MRFLIWLIRHGRIMSNKNRHQRGFTEDNRCWLCKNTVEDTKHLIRKCLKAESVWKSVLPEFTRKADNLPFIRWLDLGIFQRNQSRQPYCNATLFAITIWWLWKWRNEAIFSNIERPTNLKINWIFSNYRQQAIQLVSFQKSAFW